MGLLRGVVKGAIATKVISVAQRELRKPENQRRIKQALRKVSGR
ncbi:MAG: hypothetical protein ACTH2Q_19825 [Propionibacteriaceae bacterium]